LVSLTSGEYALLQVFVEHPEYVLTRDQLLEATKGRDAGPFDRSVDVQLSRLRKKIEVDPKNPLLIKTVRSGGYVLSSSIEYLA
jgi:two-component system OmpR family response regulator